MLGHEGSRRVIHIGRSSTIKWVRHYTSTHNFKTTCLYVISRIKWSTSTILNNVKLLTDICYTIISTSNVSTLIHHGHPSGGSFCICEHLLAPLLSLPSTQWSTPPKHLVRKTFHMKCMIEPFFENQPWYHCWNTRRPRRSATLGSKQQSELNNIS